MNDQVLWRADLSMRRPTMVGCPNGAEYPARDADGHRIYIGSKHFASEEECWRYMLESASIRRQIEGRELRAALDAASRCRESLAVAEQYESDLKGNHKRWATAT